jgi:hypothetical protein
MPLSHAGRVAPVGLEDIHVGHVGRNVILTFLGTTFLLALIPAILDYPNAVYPDAQGHASLEAAISDRFSLYIQLWSIGIPAMVAFFGFFAVRNDMRDAIAGSFVIAFFIVLVEVVLLSLGQFASTTGTLRDTVVNNFMTLVGTVVAFYVGSEAAIKIGDRYADAKVEELKTRQDQLRALQPSATMNQPPE